MIKLIRTFLLLYPLVVPAQEIPIRFFEIISGDSVKLFVNHRNQFTEKHCAYFTRYTRLDKDANFHGRFKDITNDNRVLGTGQYVHGVKHGYFELYHGNGKLMLEGNYENNLPVGRWRMYYNNGLPYRTIIVHEGDTLLWTLINPKGHVDVNNGNGTYVLYKEYQSRFYYFLDLKGNVKNGRADGLWSTDWLGYFAEGMKFTLKEWYENGKLIRSNFPNKEFRNQPRLVNFFPNTYLEHVERFSVIKCPDTVRNSIEVNFRLREKIQRALNKSAKEMRKSNDSLSYEGSHFSIIKICIHERQGEHFEILRSTSEKVLHDIIPVIRQQISPKIDTGTIYISLQIEYQNRRLYLQEIDFFTDTQTLRNLSQATRPKENQ